MLAYGWVFHMGFFNFYLSMGLCFWALATAWRWSPRRMAIAAALLLVAWLAHALPVMWAGGLLAYQALARGISPRARAWLTASCVLVLALIQVVVRLAMSSFWSAQQIKMVTGADQLWVFDGKYVLVRAALLVVWALLFVVLLRDSGPRRVLSGLPFQFCVLSAAAVFLLPGTILLPGFHHNLVYVTERMSLGVGICICALLAAAQPALVSRLAMGVVALVFFGFLYRDEKILNAIEDRMDRVISQLPPGQRVVSGVDDPFLHVFGVTHMIDRVCLGRCFSYGNYEPSTGQFRIRAVADNPYVAKQYADTWDMQTGSYVVRDRDLPLLQLILDQGGRMVVRSLEAGKPCGRTSLKALPFLFPLN